jgi:hypothetical protein
VTKSEFLLVLSRYCLLVVPGEVRRYKSRRLGVVKLLLLQLYLNMYIYSCNCRVYLIAGGVLEGCTEYTLQYHVVL